MIRASKLTAEEQLAAAQEKAEKAHEESEKARKERSAHVAKLRALRLAKENADS